MIVFARVTIFCLLMLGFRSDASSQLTGELIAWHASQDSGEPAEGYLDYGRNLARTLRLLTPTQLKRVFGKNTTVKVPETLNQLLEMGSVNFLSGSSALSPLSMKELDKAARLPGGVSLEKVRGSLLSLWESVLESGPFLR